MRKRTGEVETLLRASGRSLPRGERPIPATVSSGSTALSASYAAASTGPNAAALACLPPGRNCGRQNRGWLGSLPTTKRLTWGYVRATSAAHSANAAGRAPLDRKDRRPSRVEGEDDPHAGRLLD